MGVPKSVLLVQVNFSSLCRSHGSAACMGASVRTHAGWPVTVPRSEPVTFLWAAMDAKRKARSPCESDKTKSTKLSSTPEKQNSEIAANLNFSLESIDENPSWWSYLSAMSDHEMDSGIRSVSYIIETRNGEAFKGAFDRPTAKKVWEIGVKLSGTLIYGISLNQSTDRPFMVDYELHENVEWNDCPSSIEAKIGDVTYAGRKFIERPKAPELGEDVVIRIKKTRFKIKPDQAQRWISCFGKIVGNADFENASDLSSVKCDDIVLTAKLRKHIPSMLPAYGRKMMVTYPGQSILCGKCFEPGHVRAKCEKESIPWMAYVKVFYDEKWVSKEMLGTWAELLEKKNRDEDNTKE